MIATLFIVFRSPNQKILVGGNSRPKGGSRWCLRPPATICLRNLPTCPRLRDRHRDRLMLGLSPLLLCRPRTLRPSRPDLSGRRRLSRSDEVGRFVANFLDRRDRMQDHFSPVDDLLNRAQGVDWVGGCGTGSGKRRCEQGHKHHGQNTRYVDEWVGRADFEEEGPDKA
jgi:hypothetical protein